MKVLEPGWPAAHGDRGCEVHVNTAVSHSAGSDALQALCVCVWGGGRPGLKRRAQALQGLGKREHRVYECANTEVP